MEPTVQMVLMVPTADSSCRSLGTLETLDIKIHFFEHTIHVGQIPG